MSQVAMSLTKHRDFIMKGKKEESLLGEICNLSFLGPREVIHKYMGIRGKLERRRGRMPWQV